MNSSESEAKNPLAYHIPTIQRVLLFACSSDTGGSGTTNDATAGGPLAVARSKFGRRLFLPIGAALGVSSIWRETVMEFSSPFLWERVRPSLTAQSVAMLSRALETGQAEVAQKMIEAQYHFDPLQRAALLHHDAKETEKKKKTSLTVVGCTADEGLSARRMREFSHDIPQSALRSFTTVFQPFLTAAATGGNPAAMKVIVDEVMRVVHEMRDDDDETKRKVPVIMTNLSKETVAAAFHTSLTICAVCGRIACADYLVEVTSTPVDPPNMYTDDGPLHAACRNTQLEMARHLVLQLGADPAAVSIRGGLTPLRCALNGVPPSLQKHSCELVEFLIASFSPPAPSKKKKNDSNKATTDADGAAGDDIEDDADVAAIRKHHVNVQDQKKLTSLHHACGLGCIRCVKALVAAGADVNVADVDGATPALTAVQSVPHAVQSRLQSLQQQQEEDQKSDRQESSSSSSSSPSSSPSSSLPAHWECAKLLVEVHGADLFYQQSFVAHDLLYFAILQNNIDAVTWICKLGKERRSCIDPRLPRYKSASSHRNNAAGAGLDVDISPLTLALRSTPSASAVADFLAGINPAGSKTT